MRLLAILASIGAMLVAAPAHAQAHDWHFHPSLAHRSLPARAAGQRLIIRHDRGVLSFFRTRPDVVKASPARATRIIHYHQAELRWTTAQLHRTLTALHPGTSNRELGRRLAARFGWIGSEWAALERLWSFESGWSTHAQNSSGACGIPQNIDGCSSYSAFEQIMWGLRYIAGRYHRPSVALAHFYAYGWY